MKLCLVRLFYRYLIIARNFQLSDISFDSIMSILFFSFYKQLAVVLVAGVLAEPEAESKPWYGYRGYGGYAGYWGRKRREADSDAVAKPEADAWYGYGYYPYYLGGYHYLGKREAEAEPQPWYGYGGYGYGGYGRYWGRKRREAEADSKPYYLLGYYPYVGGYGYLG